MQNAQLTYSVTSRGTEHGNDLAKETPKPKAWGFCIN
jgi:hypothetical protein